MLTILIRLEFCAAIIISHSIGRLVARERTRGKLLKAATGTGRMAWSFGSSRLASLSLPRIKFF
jgi:hypothetical protein